MVKKIKRNYVRIVGINSSLIILGVTGTIQPTTSALLHNTSTLAISMDGMNGWKTGDNTYSHCRSYECDQEV